MTTATPLYLQTPDQPERTYGTLEYDDARDQWVLKCEPAAAEFAKRLFPGVNDRKTGELRFGATRRLTGELNWFLLRWPLKILQPERYAEQQKAAIQHALRRGVKQRASPRSPPPTFRGELMEFQKRGLTFLIENERSVLAWQQGLGKTVAALAALATAKAWPCLIVVKPGILPTQWQESIGEFLDLPSTQHVPRQRQQRLDDAEDADVDVALQQRGALMSHIIEGTKGYDLPKAPIYIIHYGLLAAWRERLEGLGLKAIVFDEIHELRHATTAKYSAASALSSGARYVWGLSGTPIFNYGAEIWSVLNIVDFHCLADRDSFTIEWCTSYGSDRVKDPKALGAYLREEGLLLREVKKDVQGEMPPKVRKVIKIDHDDAKFRQLVGDAIRVALRYDSIKDWQEKGQAKRMAEGSARRASGEAKAPAAAAFIAGLLAAGERVMVFAHHHVVHEILRDMLSPYNPVSITGHESVREKLAARQAFISGSSNLALVAIRGAAGLDKFQRRGTCVVFAELDWSPAQHEQDEDRLHRVGMDMKLPHVMCYYLVSDTGIDDTMQEALGLKKSQFVGIMGDEDDTDSERELAQIVASEHMDRVIESLKDLGKAGGLTQAPPPEEALTLSNALTQAGLARGDSA